MNLVRIFLKAACMLGVAAPFVASISWAQNVGSPVKKPTTGQGSLLDVWRPEKADDVETPQKEPTADGGDTFFSGTYQQYPYLAITKDPNGTLHVYSDGSLRAALVSLPAQKDEYDVVDDVRKITVAKLHNAHPDCRGYLDQGTPCFVLDTIEAKFKRELGAKAEGIWVPMHRKEVNEPKGKQIYGDMFAPVGKDGDYALKCWDLSKLNPMDLQNPRCEFQVFADLDGASQSYKKVNLGSGDAAIPYSWKYVSVTGAKSSNRTNTAESGQDIAKSEQSSLGTNVEANVFFATVKAYYSQTLKKNMEDMYKNEETSTWVDYMWTDYAFVLDKSNISLSRVFLDNVERLKTDYRTQIGNHEDGMRAFRSFVDDWGTHYAAGITFGVRGRHTLKFTKSQLMTLLEQGADIKAGVSAGVNFFGVGASAGVDVGTAQSAKKTITDATALSVSEDVCWGGSDCQNGSPNGNNVVPVQADLRPVSDLLGPPFFVDYSDSFTMTTLRDGLAKAIAERAFFSDDKYGKPAAQFLKLTLTPEVIDKSATRFVQLSQDGKVLKDLSGGAGYPFFVVVASETGGVPALSLSTDWATAPHNFDLPFSSGVPRSVSCAGAQYMGPGMTQTFAAGIVTKTAVVAWDAKAGWVMSYGPYCDANDINATSYGNWKVKVEPISGATALGFIKAPATLASPISYPWLPGPPVGDFGMDIPKYCTGEYGSGSHAENASNATNGWKCMPQGAGLDLQKLCDQQYGPGFSPLVPDERTGNWVCRRT